MFVHNFEVLYAIRILTVPPLKSVTTAVPPNLLIGWPKSSETKSKPMRNQYCKVSNITFGIIRILFSGGGYTEGIRYIRGFTVQYVQELHLCTL